MVSLRRRRRGGNGTPAQQENSVFPAPAYGTGYGYIEPPLNVYRQDSSQAHEVVAKPFQPFQTLDDSPEYSPSAGEAATPDLLPGGLGLSPEQAATFDTPDLLRLLREQGYQYKQLEELRSAAADVWSRFYSPNEAANLVRSLYAGTSGAPSPTGPTRTPAQIAPSVPMTSGPSVFLPPVPLQDQDKERFAQNLARAIGQSPPQVKADILNSVPSNIIKTDISERIRRRQLGQAALSQGLKHFVDPGTGQKYDVVNREVYARRSRGPTKR